MKRVLLTRPQKESEQSAAQLQALGFKTLIMPLTELKITPFHLKEPLKALIFTSFRALEAIQNLQDFNHLPSFVVGKRTKEALEKKGFATVFLASDGLDLSKMVNNSPHNDFLWASGKITAVDIKTQCPKKQIERHIVYEMEKQPQKIDCSTQKIDFALHYSLETLEYFLQSAKNIEKTHHICLSPRIARPLPATVLCSIAYEPNEKSLFACLMREKTAI